MKRDYATGTAETITYFTGVEIEKTPAYGMQTLFVVGVRPLEEITDIVTQRRCDHVYLGANQSFDGKDINDWDKMIKGDQGMESIYTWNAEGAYEGYRGASGSGDGVHILTGPIYVNDAMPGDLLKVEILDLAGASFFFDSIIIFNKV